MASSINASGIAALGYVVIVSTFFGYGVWYRLMSRHPASTVAPFTLLVRSRSVSSMRSR